MLTVPQFAARTVVPVGAAMSSPLWMWSPRLSPYGLVSVPLLTGATIRPSDVQPPLPVAGAEDVGAGADSGAGAWAGAGSDPVDGDGVSTSSRRSTRSERSGAPEDDGVSTPAEAMTVRPDDADADDADDADDDDGASKY